MFDDLMVDWLPSRLFGEIDDHSRISVYAYF